MTRLVCSLRRPLQLAVICAAVCLRFVTTTQAMQDPTTGRWITRDPIGYDGGTSNLFEYLRSSPTYWKDPSGLWIHWEFGPKCTEADKARAKKLLEQAGGGTNPDGKPDECNTSIRTARLSKNKWTIYVDCKTTDKDSATDVDPVTPDNLMKTLEEPRSPVDAKTTLRLNYQPKNNRLSDGGLYDPESTLAHEAVHARHMLQGTSKGKVLKDSKGNVVTDAKGKARFDMDEEETRAGNAENEHRRNRGIEQRKKYSGVLPLKQYPLPPSSQTTHGNG